MGAPGSQLGPVVGGDLLEDFKEQMIKVIIAF